MTYRKPEIEVLGEALRVIQAGKAGSLLENNFTEPSPVPPAYELDE